MSYTNSMSTYDITQMGAKPGGALWLNGECTTIPDDGLIPVSGCSGLSACDIDKGSVACIGEVTPCKDPCGCGGGSAGDGGAGGEGGEGGSVTAAQAEQIALDCYAEIVAGAKP